MTIFSFMTKQKKKNFGHSKHKKKNAIHSKYENIDEMSYSELKVAFANLYGEVVDAFKRLVSNKKIFSYYEAKILETEKQMKALKKIMIDAQKDKI